MTTAATVPLTREAERSLPTRDLHERDDDDRGREIDDADGRKRDRERAALREKREDREHDERRDLSLFVRDERGGCDREKERSRNAKELIHGKHVRSSEPDAKKLDRGARSEHGGSEESGGAALGNHDRERGEAASR